MKIITLEYPIEIDGVTVTTVTVKRHATVKDLIFAGGDLDDDELHFRVAANLTEIAPKDFERLDFEDIEAINEAAAQLGKDLSVPFGHELRRPTGRDILDLKRDWKVQGLIKVISRLSGASIFELENLETSVFLEQVNTLMGFLGRRRKK